MRGCERCGAHLRVPHVGPEVGAAHVLDLHTTQRETRTSADTLATGPCRDVYKMMNVHGLVFWESLRPVNRACCLDTPSRVRPSLTGWIDWISRPASSPGEAPHQNLQGSTREACLSRELQQAGGPAGDCAHEHALGAGRDKHLRPVMDLQIQ
jgi:hypothetical protein